MIEKYLMVGPTPWRIAERHHIVFPGKYQFESRFHYWKWKYQMKKNGWQIMDSYKFKPLDGSPLNLAKSYEWWDEID